MGRQAGPGGAGEFFPPHSHKAPARAPAPVPPHPPAGPRPTSPVHLYRPNCQKATALAAATLREFTPRAMGMQTV